MGVYTRSWLQDEQSSLCLSCKKKHDGIVLHLLCFVIHISAGAVVGIVVAVVAAGMTLLWGEQAG